jgi:hypothetical protein
MDRVVASNPFVGGCRGGIDAQSRHGAATPL